ncbi:DNA primase family protein [Brachybacterium hainanense]|uniref:Phage/plasmid primase, P4 family n=1 Tax=Brachybacterium hainanense TaxID=1541174 RepID=A0ABV6RC52_9MICO
MSIIPGNHDDSNEQRDEVPVFDDDLEVPDAPAANPLIDALEAAIAHFSAGGEGLAPINEVVDVCTGLYLDAIDADAPPSPGEIEKHLLAIVNGVSKMENTKTSIATEKLPTARVLTYWQVAQILLRLHHVVRIAPSTEDTDREYDVLAMYVHDGRSRGLHTPSEHDIRTTARKYNKQLSLKEFAEVQAVLQEDAPRVQRCAHRDLVPVNNGAFNYSRHDIDLEIDGKKFHFPAKSMSPFDPSLVFLSKVRVDYVKGAINPVIVHPVDGTRWDVVSWIKEFYYTQGDDAFNAKYAGMAELIWEIIGAVVRPNVRWGKSAWFYSEQGNNGKGTLCSLMRNLVGAGSHTSIPLLDFDKDFALEPLLRATAIIVDENDVGAFIEKAANLKAIETNDVIPINRKYRMPIAFQFWGFMVQCLNGFPRMKDKSESNYRRKLFVPFDKSFTGAERKYIKDDYLQRPEVLQYVLWYVLHEAGAADPGSYYELSEPVATQEVLADFKEVNDPVRAFWEEFRERFAWDLLPFTFLYDLFKAWFREVSPSGSPVSMNQFRSDLLGLVRTDPMWHCADKSKKHRPGNMMALPEILIAEYELAKWLSPTFKGSDITRRSKPVLSASYRGILRRTGATTDGTTSTDDTED